MHTISVSTQAPAAPVLPVPTQTHVLRKPPEAKYFTPAMPT